MELNESYSIVQFDESLQSMPSHDEEQRSWKMRSIYRVPAHFIDLHRKAYRSQVVSFGPYHHGEDHLLPMEEHKRRVLRHFLKRSRKPLERFFESLREVAWDLEGSYDALDVKWKAGSGEGAAGRFLELMITDGCFMLEIMRFATKLVDDYAPNDPIFSYHGKRYIMQDMLKLENQLPMLVLDRLVAVESDCNEDDEFVNRLILTFCNMPIERMGKCLHFLDVVSKGRLMEPEKKDKVESKYSGEIVWLASATELSEHGIQFKINNTGSLKDISFAGGVLKLPTMVVDDSSESVFINLMAFECLHVGARNEVISYFYFMDCIINNARDVALLCTQGIIKNGLGSDEAAAQLFNSLGKDLTVDITEFSFIDVFKKIDKYCNKPWNMWRANLIQTYFRNPWVTLSLIAAAFLFALTIIQTVYTVLSYNK